MRKSSRVLIEFTYKLKAFDKLEKFRKDYSVM